MTRNGVNVFDYLSEIDKQECRLSSKEGYSDLFEHVLIQTNNLCTRKCNYCYYGNRKDEGALYTLEDSLFYSIIDQLYELNYSGRIGLFDINEPLTDSRIFNFIQYAKEKLPKAWHMLISNGDLLNATNVVKLFESGLDNLFISMYDDYTIAKIDKLEKDLPQYLNRINKMDFTNFDFVDNRGGNVKHKGGCETINSPCERVYKVLSIHPSGFIHSCFNDFYGVNEIGNLNEYKLIDLWNNTKFRFLRSNLDKGNRGISKLCANCNYPGKGGFFTKPK